MKKLITAAVIVVLGVLVLALYFGYFANKDKSTDNLQKAQTPAQVSPNDKPQVVSTKPEPLEDTIISATENIEITFNRPLENVGEFKSRLEPNLEYKVELSSDRKTARIIPLKPYPLGTTFTLFIGTETKFDGVGRWGEEKVFHFKTIKYTGV